MNSEREAAKRVRIGLVLRPREGVVEAIREQVAALRGAGHEVLPRLTFEAGDGTRLGGELAELGVDRIVAAGGDGTLNEVVNGVMGTAWAGAVAVIPLGTGNDFAHGAGIPEALDAAFAVAVDGHAREVDVGRVNGRYFVNVSTGGFGVTATEEAAAEAKRVLGPLAYVVTGVKQFVELRPSRVRFETPTGPVFEGEVMLFAVGNGKRTGGGSHVTPRAELDDGLLDVVIVPALPRMDFVALLPDLRAGTHLDDPAVRYLQTEGLVVESEDELSVNADGERIPGNRFEYSVADRRLRIMVPG